MSDVGELLRDLPSPAPRHHPPRADSGRPRPFLLPRIEPSLAVAGGAFFLSGVAALVYQVSWQRILELGSGSESLSVALIVGAFMAGIGIGSALGGAWSARVSRRLSLGLFALEI